MRVIDTMEGIEQAVLSYDGDTKSIMKVWRKYIKPFPEVQKLCEEDVEEDGTGEFILPIMHRALSQDADIMREAHKNFVKVADVIKKPLQEICKEANDIDLYFYMGLCNGAGWATELNNRGTILIGAEKVAELKWQSYDQMFGLISHELSHEVHRLIRGESIDKEFDSPEETWIWQLYMEGYAQRVQQLIQQNNSYHQDDGKWLEYCRENQSRLKNIYLERLIAGESLNDFYGSWNTFEGYADLGYYLGSVWIDELLKVYSLETVARFKMDDIKKMCYQFLKR